MLTALTRRNRWRAALALATLYGFCVLMPAAALAFTSAATHCLTDMHGAHVHQAAAKAHVHADGTAHAHDRQTSHRHADDNAPQQLDGDKAKSCCGLFCVTAIAQDTPAMLATPVAAKRTVPLPQEARSGRGPDRINRPPIG